jgi:hypothetical protein
VNAVVPSAIDTPALDKLGLDPETKTAFDDFSCVSDWRG